MKVLKIFFYAILGILALYLLACIVLPDRFEVSRSIEIDADLQPLFLIKSTISLIGTTGKHGQRWIAL